AGLGRAAGALGEARAGRRAAVVDPGGAREQHLDGAVVAGRAAVERLDAGEGLREVRIGDHVDEARAERAADRGVGQRVVRALAPERAAGGETALGRGIGGGDAGAFVVGAAARDRAAEEGDLAEA